jgi:predicted RNA-binding Zn-ribbon protein involved in translation (DUF1610 family)
MFRVNVNSGFTFIIHNQLIRFAAKHEEQETKHEKVNDKMMKKAAVKDSNINTIDLTKIDGDGAFPCPKCGILISPDDETEETYQIVETVVKDDELAELILTCNKCGTKIKLTGFMPQHGS